ncbi:hypothetical protein [Trinickia mobilis]|uniref:hypothetical protein n=1 Tax=Trinickia mobilis TaxID=2816356 RepID=UPI001F5C7F18|nr:hypothetical protein [Trinickia mobilis]
MKNRLVAALLVAVSTSFAVPAFASGYGPAPFYRPSEGAPASQRGQSAQTLAAERDQANAPASAAYGGAAPEVTQSGRQSGQSGLSVAERNLYRGR